MIIIRKVSIKRAHRITDPAAFTLINAGRAASTRSFPEVFAARPAPDSENGTSKDCFYSSWGKLNPSRPAPTCNNL